MRQKKTKEHDSEAILQAWIDYAARADADDDEHFWACELVDDLVRSDPEAAWPLILELVRRSQSDDLLANVAAGPLEDLLVRHGEAFIERVERQAQADRRFRKCLRGVWGWSAIPKDVQARIQAAVKDEPQW
jgi:hypothetical protein